MLLAGRSGHPPRFGHLTLPMRVMSGAKGGAGGTGLTLTPSTSTVSSSRFCAPSGTDSSVPTGSFLCRGTPEGEDAAPG